MAVDPRDRKLKDELGRGLAHSLEASPHSGPADDEGIAVAKFQVPGVGCISGSAATDVSLCSLVALSGN